MLTRLAAVGAVILGATLVAVAPAAAATACDVVYTPNSGGSQGFSGGGGGAAASPVGFTYSTPAAAVSSVVGVLRSRLYTVFGRITG